MEQPSLSIVATAVAGKLIDPDCVTGELVLQRLLNWSTEHGLSMELVRRLLTNDDYRSHPASLHLRDLVDFLGGPHNTIELLYDIESVARRIAKATKGEINDEESRQHRVFMNSTPEDWRAWSFESTIMKECLDPVDFRRAIEVAYDCYPELKPHQLRKLLKKYGMVSDQSAKDWNSEVKRIQDYETERKARAASKES